MKKKRIFVVVLCSCFLILSAGCDSFVRKFTRKSKKDKEVETQLVLAPEEYRAPLMSKEEVYRQNLLFWKSWQGELIESLNTETAMGFNHKKQLSCAKESLASLEQLRKLLNPEKQKLLDVYIKKMKVLQEDLIGDSYNANASLNRSRAEDIRRNVLRDFSYQKIKGFLI